MTPGGGMPSKESLMKRFVFFFFIDKKDLPLKGNYVALRTNGIKLSFAPEDADK